jgi:membrane dipeptidase
MIRICRQSPLRRRRPEERNSLHAVTAAIEERIERLHSQGLIDLHFDLPMELFEKREQGDLLATQFLPQFEAGKIALVAAAVFIEERYLPDKALPVALGQIARLYAEADRSERVVICRSYREIMAARAAGRIGFLITMEGAEPVGTDLDLLRIFYELGLRVMGLTHARRNAVASGGIFAAAGSPAEGLTPFGRKLVAECEALGIIIDLAHINAAGFDEIVAMTKKPLIVSHSNARRFYDIERNVSDAQIRMIGDRRGVVGINSVLVSAEKETATLDRYVDHIEHVIELIGVDGVGIGFDFFEFIYRQWPESSRRNLAGKLAEPHFIPDLADHSHARNLTRRLIERGFSDEEIEKILFRNWLRILEELL